MVNVKEIEDKLRLAMELVCFKSLSFCCDKECTARNQAIELLGLTKEEFYELKHQFDENLVRLLVKKSKEE